MRMLICDDVVNAIKRVCCLQRCQQEKMLKNFDVITRMRYRHNVKC
jgi:hypothetical protein